MTHKARITKSLAAAFKAGDRETVLWDETVAGFGMRVTPTGHKSWIIVYRLPGSRRLRKVTLGSLEKMSVEQARALALEYLASAMKGDDMRETVVAKTRAKEAARIAAANRITSSQAVDRFMAAYETTPSRRTGRLVSEGSLVGTRQWLRPLAALNKPLEDVSETDVVQVVQASTPGVRSMAHGAVRRLFRWAMRQGLVAIDPTANLDPPPPPKAREACPTPAEVRHILRTVEGMVVSKKMHQTSADVVTLIALTGARRSEVAGMEWQHISFDSAMWEQPSHSNKSRRTHRVPLAPTALAILKRRWEDAGGPKAGLCLPAPRTGSNFHTSLSKVMERVCREAEVDYNLHDFRRAIASGLADAGVPIDVADGLLNHAASATRKGVVGVYQKSEQLTQRREALVLWESLVSNANIVPFKQRSA